MLTLTNQARAQARTCADPGGQSGSFPAVPPLTWNVKLGNSARGHSQDMATHNYFAHDSQDGTTPFQRMNAAGYHYSAAGENIAAGYSTPQAVVNTWLSDYGHCANIMSSAFTELGVGYAYATGSTYKHYWTQDFGRPR